MKNRRRLLVPRWCSGHLFFCSCDSAVRFLDSQNPGQRRLPLSPAPRRVHFARPRTQASKPTLTDSTLAAERRAEALHVVVFQPGIRAQHDELLLCVYSRLNVATKDARWVRCFSCSLGPSPRRLVASYSLAAERRGNCVRASLLYS